MIINKITLKNHKLFKNLSLTFDKINIIKGDNGVGKSTILKSIIFATHGEGSGSNLQRLISFGEKSTEVTSEITINNENYRIIRKVPTELSIYKNDKEINYNTSTLKQQWINGQIGDYEFFKKYRLINKQAINLLDLGITPLRKSIMDFVNTQSIIIRQSLLAKKLERETFNVNKRWYTFHLSTKKQTLLETGLLKLQEDLTSAKNDYEEQHKIVGDYKSEIDSRKKIIYYKEQDNKKINEGICPVLKIKCEKITSKNKVPNLDITKEVNIIKGEIEEITNLLKSENDCLQHCSNQYEFMQKRVQRTKEYLMKLNETQKFAAYKYTKEDIQLFSDSVKTWDSFSGWYIQTWLDNLTYIINDLLKEMDLAVSFSADKQFLTIINEGKENEYNDLSSGQQVFLNVVFKLAILLNNGIADGIVIIDEGINDLKLNNMLKLLEILKTLPFQVFLVYQNIPEIKDVNVIELERKMNQSYIKVENKINE